MLMNMLKFLEIYKRLLGFPLNILSYTVPRDSRQYYISYWIWQSKFYTHTNNQQALKLGHLSNELDTLV